MEIMEIIHLKRFLENVNKLATIKEIVTEASKFQDRICNRASFTNKN